MLVLLDQPKQFRLLHLSGETSLHSRDVKLLISLISLFKGKSMPLSLQRLGASSLVDFFHMFDLANTRSKGKSLLNLLISLALPSLCCASRISLASFSLCRLDLMKLYSSYAFLIFLPQALHTRSDISADLSTLNPILEHSSAKEKSVSHPFIFETFNKFSVEIYKVFWKSPNLIFKGQQHNLQKSFALLRLGSLPRSTVFFSAYRLLPPSTKRMGLF